jgi:exopolysaccharide production protein ExoZ
LFKSLQAARAIAAFMVVLFHLGAVAEKYYSLSFLTSGWGRAGVEFFFVLSGFIIANAHWDDIGKPERLSRFAWKRFVRIYPVYWAVFLLAFAGAFRIVSLSPAEALLALTLAPTGVAPPVIAVAWSLQWEVVFYVLFGALILHPALALAGLLAVLAWLPGAPYFLLLFLLGVGCARVAQSSAPVPGRTLALLGAAAYAGACWLESTGGTPTAAWYGLAAAAVILGLVRSERAGHIFGASPLMQLLGNASYSIYLVHYPLMSATFKASVALGLHGTTAGVLVYLVALLATPVAGVAVHVLAERPMMAWLNARRARPLIEPVPQ